MTAPPPSRDLEHELSIPPSATLSLPASAAFASLSCCGSAVPVSSKTSIRSLSSPLPPRCLVVGRLAATSDLRIDHGSISRRHAALYYVVNDRSDKTGRVRPSLVLRDLGGKHGARVNGVRVEKNSTATLQDGDEIVFGKVSQQRFKVSLPPDWGCVLTAEEVGAAANGGSIGASSDADENAATEADGKRGGTPVKDDAAAEAGAGLSGRAKREAEIAAMMASFEQAPTYQKYQAPDDDEEQYGGENEDQLHRDAAPLESDSRSRGIDADGEGENEHNPHRLPITRCAPLDSSAASPPDVTSSEYRTGGGKIICALSVDPSGSRLVTGCTDAILRMYDFSGMDSSHRSFREVEAEEGHPIVCLKHSNTGDRMVVGTTSAQPKILDRDGREILQFNKGDPYVTDQSRTTGHTAAVTAVDWHPLERDVVLTSSLDGSARLWNLNGKTQFSKLLCDRVIRAKNARGQRTGVTCAVFHPGGREVALGTSDGSVQIWSCAGAIKTRPDRVVYDVHGLGCAVHSLAYNVDGTRLASRSMDDTAAVVWDARKLSKSSAPIAVCAGLPNLYELSNCAFSPDGNVLCAGTSVEPPRRGGQQQALQNGTGRSSGKLRLYKLPGKYDPPAQSPLIPVAEVDAASPGASAIRVLWHPKLNQIVVGTSDGNARVCYDPTHSTRGALLSASKLSQGTDDLSLLLQSRAPTGSAAITTEIVTPHALPMFQTEKQRRKAKRSKRQRDELKEEDDRTRHKPEAPSTDKARIGGATSAAGANFTQFVVQSMGMTKNKNIAGKDPREDLFRYKEGKKSYVSKAYEGDVQRVLAEKTAEEEEADIREGKKEG